MRDEARRRLTWIRRYEETRDVGLVCRRCGISAPTPRKWLRRYAEQGEAGLDSLSRRPQTSPRRKVVEREEAWILELRRERNLGARRIQQELRRRYNCRLGLEAIHTVLTRHAAAPLRYSAALPGERAQMDTIKLAPGLYQYTFVDDCTRYLVAALYPRRTAANTLDFLEQVRGRGPLPPSGSKPTTAQNSWPTRSATSCSGCASSTGRSRRARRTSTAKSSGRSRRC